MKFIKQLDLELLNRLFGEDVVADTIRKHFREDLTTKTYHRTVRALSDDEIEEIETKKHCIVSHNYVTKYPLRITSYVRFEDQNIETWGTAWVKGVEIIVTNYDFPYDKLARKLLEDRFTWFNDFNWDIYKSHAQIYLKIPGKAAGLFVNLEDLVTFNWKNIIRKHIKYYVDYYYSTTPKQLLRKLKTNTYLERKAEPYANTTRRVMTSDVVKSFISILKAEIPNV